MKKLAAMILAAALMLGCAVTSWAALGEWQTSGLSKTEREIYEGMVKDLEALKSSVTISFSGTDKQAQKAFGKAIELIKKQNPEIFWLSYDAQSCTTWPESKRLEWTPKFMPEFTKDGKLNTQAVKDAQQKIAQTVKSAGTGKSAYESVTKFTEWLNQNVTYTYDYSNSHSYEVTGSLIDRKSACEGFAKAFKMMCDNAKIDCVVVSGTGIGWGKTYVHEWCYVKMDDGKWYLMDPTWNNISSNHMKWFLLGSGANVDGMSLLKSHIPDGSAYPELAVNNYGA